ncbi:MAG TPA: hypothetical protein PLS00_07345 [Niabella sp.]|nr:hypothetical protein [Agriterribacter sp.]HUN02654.1 hypothetical protein [Niabella sp.]
MVKASTEMILTLHECYSPSIKVFGHKLHEDIYGQVYYKALYTALDGTKHGFIVRNEFLEKWEAFLIAEIYLQLTSKGATLRNYNTFDSLEEEKRVEFIEIHGIFIKGIYEVKLADSEESKLVYIIPFLSSMFSFNLKRIMYYGVSSPKIFKTFKIKFYGLGSVALVVNKAFLSEDKDTFKEDTHIYVILERHYDICFYEYDEQPYVETTSLVFKEESNENGFFGKQKDYQYFDLPKEKYEPIKIFIETRKKELLNECEFILGLHDLVKKFTSNLFKIEFTIPNGFEIEDLNTRKQLYYIDGSPYIRQDLALGLERSLTYVIDPDEWIETNFVFISVNLTIQV